MYESNRSLRESYEALIKSVIKKEPSESFENLNQEKVARVIYLTSTYGWYIDDFSSGVIFNKCLRYIYGNLPEKLDEYLALHYEKRIIAISERLSENFPHRKQIFEEAFEAFEANKYFSCITLLLPQVDGICLDKEKAKYFLHNKKNDFLPEVEMKLRNTASSFCQFLLSPISKKTAINSHQDSLETFPVRLNRHEILHGIDYEYGTRLNALRIISLLSYIDYVLNHLDETKWESTFLGMKLI